MNRRETIQLITASAVASVIPTALANPRDVENLHWRSRKLRCQEVNLLPIGVPNSLGRVYPEEVILKAIAASPMFLGSRKLTPPFSLLDDMIFTCHFLRIEDGFLRGTVAFRRELMPEHKKAITKEFLETALISDMDAAEGLYDGRYVVRPVGEGRLTDVNGVSVVADYTLLGFSLLPAEDATC